MRRKVSIAKWEKDTLASDEDYKQWKQYSGQIRTKLRLPSASSPWTDGRLKKVSCHGVPLTARILDLINVGYSWGRDNCPKTSTTQEIIRDLWVNVSQSIHRSPWAAGTCPAYVRSSLFYNYEHDCCLSRPVMIN